jgi:hypothetical protein
MGNRGSEARWQRAEPLSAITGCFARAACRLGRRHAGVRQQMRGNGSPLSESTIRMAHGGETFLTVSARRRYVVGVFWRWRAFFGDKPRWA